MDNQAWHRSSYSSDTGGNCVEVAETWHKSSYSGATHQNCVEVAEASRSMLVRDTQNRQLGHLDFGVSAWSAFVADVKAEEL